MSLNINAIETYTDIPDCMMAEEVRSATLEDNYTALNLGVAWLTIYKS